MEGDTEDLLEILRNLSLSDYHRMVESSHFTADEVRHIQERRKNFEAKIGSGPKTAMSFQEYVDYETGLLKDLGMRMYKRKSQEHKNIGYSIVQRIKMLYVAMLRTFPNDNTIFAKYLKFLKSIDQETQATELISEILMKRWHDPVVWNVAATFQAEDCSNMPKALSILSRAIHKHPSNQRLFIESLKMELTQIAKCTNPEPDAEQLQQSVERMKRNVAKMLSAMKCGEEFFLDILQSMEKDPYTVPVQELIADHLMKNFCDNEVVWHVLAQRERNSPMPWPRPQFENYNDDEAFQKSYNYNGRLKACFAKYKQGVSAMSPSCKPKLWKLYIDFLLRLLNEYHPRSKGLRLEALRAALSKASDDGCLSERHYRAWIRVENPNRALQVAEKATAVMPTSVSLWVRRLKLQILQDDRTLIDHVFKMGVNALKENALDLWLTLIRYHCLTSNDEYMKMIFEDGIRQPKQVSEELKVEYMRWLVMTQGFDVARRIYMRLAKEKPYCKRMYEAIVEFRSLCSEDMAEWERIYKLACDQFGVEDIDVWLDCLNFYIFYKNEIIDAEECMEDVYRRAVAKLNPEHRTVFQAKYKAIMKSEGYLKLITSDEASVSEPSSSAGDTSTSQQTSIASTTITSPPTCVTTTTQSPQFTEFVHPSTPPKQRIVLKPATTASTSISLLPLSRSASFPKVAAPGKSFILIRPPEEPKPSTSTGSTELVKSASTESILLINLAQKIASSSKLAKEGTSATSTRKILLFQPSPIKRSAGASTSAFILATKPGVKMNEKIATTSKPAMTTIGKPAATSQNCSNSSTQSKSTG